ARHTRPAMDGQAMRSAVTPQQIATEETKIRKVEESVRVFVRVADPKFRQIVPMRFFNLALTPAEADAYCADYVHEKSVRAEFARVLLRTVAVIARITTELEHLKRSENSASLWKLLQILFSGHASPSNLSARNYPAYFSYLLLVARQYLFSPDARRDS